MKKLLLSAIIVIAMSCSSNSDDAPATVAEDCNCDRVVEATTFNVVGTPQNPAINYYTAYTTINDCTGVQRERNHTTTVASEIPKVGQCR
jgi:hypothetical protein